MKAEKAKVTRLLKTARGQIDGILKMAEDDRYCIDISTQLMATEALLRRVNREVLQAHMLGCVAEAFESPTDEAKAEKIGEILAIINKLQRQD